MIFYNLLSSITRLKKEIKNLVYNGFAKNEFRDGIFTCVICGERNLTMPNKRIKNVR